MKRIQKRILDYAKRNGLSLNKMAKGMGITVQALSAFLKSKHPRATKRYEQRLIDLAVNDVQDSGLTTRRYGDRIVMDKPTLAERNALKQFDSIVNKKRTKKITIYVSGTMTFTITGDFELDTSNDMNEELEYHLTREYIDGRD